MSNLPETRPEMRYGLPAADQIIFNRFYITGYSYYFRQAKWALETVNSNEDPGPYVDRMDNFRSDLRVPTMFRAELKDYQGSGFDRGHLVASANQREGEYQNSETFLLSNMSPQRPELNRRIWRTLEKKVRELDSAPNILETFSICGPIFNFNQSVEVIGDRDGNDVTIPIPHAHFKALLTEDRAGTLDFYAFIIPNEPDVNDTDLAEFLSPTEEVEYKAGIFLWDKVSGTSVERKKKQAGQVWW